MKNSAEIKSGFSLFSIDEHRLSSGLLALLLLGGLGYLIWLVVAPFLPASVATPITESRNQIADSHFEDSDWDKAVSVYNQMLKDDPDNGFVILKIAKARHNELLEKWKECEKVSDVSSVENEAMETILAEEEVLFNQVILAWSRLFDNARYRRRCYERVACLHSMRFAKLKYEDESEKAIAALEEMLKHGCTTEYGIRQTRQLYPLATHRRFAHLVLEEQRIWNPGRRIRYPYPNPRK
ncbi:hypothetical protein [Mariniblastus fucicola]|uniref:Uncharacterized protein n=1 Tax=Mariniblastus fucicola TaxID=980251 RepID=A0A5B9P7Z6_9BACT|nr:hypothetical protein [Mariniblastus fucicola]QEG20736.1 hypothetical protein MFFC18_05870 [Mariniblastus fucicola]